MNCEAIEAAIACLATVFTFSAFGFVTYQLIASAGGAA